MNMILIFLLVPTLNASDITINNTNKPVVKFHTSSSKEVFVFAEDKSKKAIFICISCNILIPSLMHFLCSCYFVKKIKGEPIKYTQYILYFIIHLIDELTTNFAIKYYGKSFFYRKFTKKNVIKFIILNIICSITLYAAIPILSVSIIYAKMQNIMLLFIVIGYRIIYVSIINNICSVLLWYLNQEIQIFYTKKAINTNINPICIYT